VSEDPPGAGAPALRAVAAAAQPFDEVSAGAACLAGDRLLIPFSQEASEPR
jgi:hypothetical protein